MKLAMPLNFLRGRIVCAVVCLVLFVSFQLFAALPKLHNWIHSDSSSATHHCSLTLLTQGQVNTTANEGLITALVSVSLPATPLTGASVLLSDHCQLPHERAPPPA